MDVLSVHLKLKEHDTTGASGKMSYLTLKMAPIRMITMHTILLGMIHNEIKLIISTLAVNQLSEFYSRIQAVKIPYDLGRLPTNLNGDSLAGLTAQQWKNFACYICKTLLSRFAGRKGLQKSMFIV